jgi:ribosomal protein L11 methyltransferase
MPHNRLRRRLSRVILRTPNALGTRARPLKHPYGASNVGPASKPVLNTHALTSRTGPRHGRNTSGRKKITATIVVKPSWREYPVKPGEIIVEIDPGMAFGTGTHPTTALCIHLIQNHLKPGASFLDVGTGSGILMITAAKLGAGTLWGVDNDDMAIEVAEKNLLANRIDHFSLSCGNLIDAVHLTFDVVAANILAEVILALLPDLMTVLADNGVFICSGIIAAKKNAVLSELNSNGFKVLQVMEKEGWVAISAEKAAAT